MITGIIPAVHVNTVGIIIFSISTMLLEYTSALVIATFLVTIAIVHAMFEFIPSLIIGIPTDDTIMSIQPAHRLLFEGRGHEVIRLISVGGFLSILCIIALLPILFVALPFVYSILKDYIGYLLVVVMCIILYKTRGNWVVKLITALVFLMSGILGVVVLNGNLGSNLGLLCMLSGLFSISNLIYNFNTGSSIPPQDDVRSINVDGDFKRSVFAGSISGCILGLLPGLGPAQGTLIAQSITLKDRVGSRDFLVTNSGINITDTLFSLIAIYLISNPRSAISMYVSYLISDITFVHVLFFICVSVVVVSISCVLSIKIGDGLLDKLHFLNYRKLNLFVIILVSFLVFFYCILSGGCIWYVFICYVTSIGMGLLVNVLDLNKSVLMGVLILPSILIYLGMV